MSRTWARLGGALGALLLLGGCLSPPPGPDGRVDPDPLQGSNRAVFGFNEGVDRWVLNPLAEGWEFVTPKQLRVALDKAFFNLGFLDRFFSNLGQGKPKYAGTETLRFLVNTTLGLAGLFDPASRFGIPRTDEDFGQMFAVWGLGSGPYWVLPLFGPSNPRDAWGLLFDSALNPVSNPATGLVVPGLGLLATVNRRAILDPQIESLRESSVDLYVAVRDGYRQRREAQIADRDFEEERALDGPSDDLYEVPEDLEDSPQDEGGIPGDGEPASRRGGS